MSQLYYYTYYYGNGDFYKGSGFANNSTYLAGQYVGYNDGKVNETGYDGYYYISSVTSANISSSEIGKVEIQAYYDAESNNYYADILSSSFSVYFPNTSNIRPIGKGTSGLGSEESTLSNSTDRFGLDYYEADKFETTTTRNPYWSVPNLGGFQEVELFDTYYTFTYRYSNGDTYQGYGYTPILDGYYNGLKIYNANGYYTIDYIQALSSKSSATGLVSVTSYYDADTKTSTSNVSASGSSGLGSEKGNAYNAYYNNVATFFGNGGAQEADLFDTRDQLFYFSFAANNGDTYGGYGYIDVGFGYSLNQTIINRSGTYTITYTYDFATNYNLQNQITLSWYYDADTKSGADYVTGGGVKGLGTEAGYAYNAYRNNTPNFFGYAGARIYEADLFDTRDQLFYFSFAANNGDAYGGYGFVDRGKGYSVGQQITGNNGVYSIYFVSNYNVNYDLQNKIYPTWYYDLETASSASSVITAAGSGYAGLGTEAGYAYNNSLNNPNNFFGYAGSYEANL
jgi:hypothetical protein